MKHWHSIGTKASCGASCSFGEGAGWIRDITCIQCCIEAMKRDWSDIGCGGFNKEFEKTYKKLTFDKDLKDLLK